MAEAFGIFTGAISVGSLAIQIFDSIQKLHAFCAAVQDVPKDLFQILEELELLGSILIELENNLDPMAMAEKARHPSVKNPLDYCRRAAYELHSLVLELGHLSKDTKMRRKWVAIKAVLKKERVEGIQKRLESSKSTLNLAISCISLQLQMEMKRSSSDLAQMASELSRVTVISPEDIAKDGSKDGFKDSSKTLSPPCRSEVQTRTKTLSPNTQTTYQESLEVASVKRQWVGIGWYINRHLMGRSRPSLKGAVSKSKYSSRPNQRVERTFLPMSFLGIKGFSMGSCNIWGNWHYTFKTIRVVPDTAPIFKICAAGNIDKVREEIDSGRATLFDTSSKGYTLLHIAAAHARPDMCLWLLNQGIPSDSVTLPRYANALHLVAIMAGCFCLSSDWAAAPTHMTENMTGRPQDVDSTVRILVEHAHLDPMATMTMGRNVLHICSTAPETFEYLLERQEHFHIDSSELMENGSDVIEHQVYTRSAYTTELMRASVGKGPISDELARRSLYMSFGPYRREIIGNSRPSGWTLLHAVLWRVLQRYITGGSLEAGFKLASELIDADADINGQSYLGVTPLDHILDFDFSGDEILQETTNNGFIRNVDVVHESTSDKYKEHDRSPLLLKWLDLLRGKGISLHEYARKEEELHPVGRLVETDYVREGIQRFFKVQYIPGGDDIIITVKDMAVEFEKPVEVPGGWVPDEDIMDFYGRSVLNNLPLSADWRVNTAVDLPPLR